MNPDRAPPGGRFETWIWRHFRLELPADWEMLQFSRDMEKGRCAFADRYRFRFEFIWRRVPGAPDFERMMGDYRARLESSGDAEATNLSIDSWRGLEVRKTAESSSRFGRFFAESGCLVELVFLWPDERSAELEQAILRSFAPEPETPSGGRRWRAFGMDVTVPSSFVLSACTVQPALARLEFAGPRAPARGSFRRLGLAPRWLNIPVGEWLAAQATRSLRNPRASTFDEAGHRIERIEGAFVPQGLLKARGQYEATAWLCPRDGRLYHAERIRGRKDPADLPALHHTLRCCTAPPRCSGGSMSRPEQDISTLVGGQDKADWIPMLRARMIPNAAARVRSAASHAELSLEVPTRRPGWLVPPVSWLVRPPAFRTLTLDALGVEVWTLCDGRRTVEEVIESFAAASGLTFHEARLSVTAYLKSLLQKGALAVAR